MRPPSISPTPSSVAPNPASTACVRAVGASMGRDTGRPWRSVQISTSEPGPVFREEVSTVPRRFVPSGAFQRATTEVCEARSEETSGSVTKRGARGVRRTTTAVVA